jgi:hypothetical protein
VSPADLTTVLRHAVEAARVGLVFVEPIGAGLVDGLSFPEWRHNYHGALTSVLNRKTVLYQNRLAQPVDRCDGLCAATFKE